MKGRTMTAPRPAPSPMPGKGGSVPAGRGIRRLLPQPAGLLLLLALAFLPGGGSSSRHLLAEVPFPSCASRNCIDPRDYASYLFLIPGQLPDDLELDSPEMWKLAADTGLNVLQAWTLSTGRPDIIAAILDSGIDWSRLDLVRKIRLNRGELPLPAGCPPDYDCNQDGVVNIDDFPFTPDWNANGTLDPQDLILAYSDGVDGDNNGFADDIAGWDFFENDNDPGDNTGFFHGTNQGLDAAAETGNGEGFPGIAPSMMLLPLRVSDTFVAREVPFARAVVYAADSGVSLISEALGTLSSSRAGQQAIDYAYRRGIPLIASAADEQSFHHNFPAAFRHTIWVNSIRNGDGTVVTEPDRYDLLNGCTNFGGQAWISVSSTGCSSEATARTAGLVGLLLSHAANLADRGLLTPLDGGRTLAAGEVRQLLRLGADDIDHSDDLRLAMASTFQLLGVPFFGPFFESRRFPTRAGWDQYTGYGRPDAARLLSLLPEVPPEVDLLGVDWFAPVPPETEISLEALMQSRHAGLLDFQLEVGCGVEPQSFFTLAAGSLPASGEVRELADWLPSETAAACGFDPVERIPTPDRNSVTLRLRVLQEGGLSGEDRRVVAIHRDPDWTFPPRPLGSSLESGATAADVDRDGVFDLVLADGSGRVHAWYGDGSPIPGFPVSTRPLWSHPSGELDTIREEVVAPSAAADLDGDGTIELVVAGLAGNVYIWDDHGRLKPGFPVHTESARSAPAARDDFNDPERGILGAPTLANLDSDPSLEILVAALDGHLYAWNADASPVPGFPVGLFDPDRVRRDPQGRLIPLDPSRTQPQLRKIAGSPAVGDLDGDGIPEIVVGTAERYRGDDVTFSTDGSLLIGLLEELAGQEGSPAEISFQLSGRLYAVDLGQVGRTRTPFFPGWPAPVPVMLPGGLPTVATGVVGSPAIREGEVGKGEVGVFSAAGPAMLLDPDGLSVLGEDQDGRPRPLGFDYPGPGFPVIPASAGSADAPFFATLGSGIYVDLDLDGIEEFVAPSAGVRQLIDIAAPGSQEFSDHQISAWNTETGQLRPGFPVIIEDLQFLQGPSAADVDGDGFPEILVGSGGYLVHAIRRDGSEAAGWPRFTGGWIVASPLAADIDGDGLLEVVATTREGYVFAWNTPSPAVAGSVPWQGFGHDPMNTQNTATTVSPTAPPRLLVEHILWLLESFWQRFRLFR